jgi:RNA 3'-terminal phosphate cyclase (ATP)
MLVIDGAKGEGGGQIIRTSLALSLITGKEFRILNIRAGREKGGLRPQHLTSVQAAAQIGTAEVKGAEVGSRQLTFRPGQLAPGSYVFKIGTAGSTMLVLQTILPPLMLAEKPSFIEFEGGTHNTKAPPFDFVANTFVPLLQRMGPEIKLQMDRFGFYPPGGGRVQAKITPSPRLTVLNLSEAKENIQVNGRSLVVKLPEHIGERENNVLKKVLSDYPLQTKVETSGNAISPGNVVFVEIANQHFTETVSSIGERGLRAETVAQAAADEALAYLQSDALVGQHLADQLLLPFALAGGGEFRTNALTDHTTTNIEVIQDFLDSNIRIAPAADNTWKISFGA